MARVPPSRKETTVNSHIAHATVKSRTDDLLRDAAQAHLASTAAESRRPRSARARSIRRRFAVRSFRRPAVA
jgi:hypothetical protein